MPSLAVASFSQLLDRLAGRLASACSSNSMETLGLGRAGMDDVDVDAVLLALLRQRLGEIAHRGVDRGADGEIGAGRARRAAADVDDEAVARPSASARTRGTSARSRTTSARSRPSRPRPADRRNCRRVVAPAEFTRMSQRPNLSFTALNTCWTPSSLRRSAVIASGAGPPAAAMVLVAAARLSVRRRHDHRLRAGLARNRPRSRGRCRGCRR